MKREWKVISSHQGDDLDVDTAVMEVPGGVVMRYRIMSVYDNGAKSVSMVFIPGAKIEDFKEEP